MSETSLFAELVKDKNLRELAMKRLAAIKEKEKDGQDDIINAMKISEATDDDINNIPIPMDNGPSSNANPPLPQTVDQVSY